MRYLFPVFLSILLVSISAWAGTWRDDFNDDDLNGWRMYKHVWKDRIIPDDGNWRIENGAVIGGDRATNITYVLLMDKRWSWADYTAEVSVKFPEPLQLWAVVTLGVAPKESNASGLDIIHLLGGTFAEGFSYVAPGLFNHIIAQPFEIKVDRWYRLKIKIVERIDDEEGIVQCFIDDQPILQFRGYRKGALGLSTCGAVVLFDNLVVTGPGIPDGGSGAKAVRPKGKLATTWAGLKR